MPTVSLKLCIAKFLKYFYDHELEGYQEELGGKKEKVKIAEKSSGAPYRATGAEELKISAVGSLTRKHLD